VWSDIYFNGDVAKFTTECAVKKIENNVNSI